MSRGIPGNPGHCKKIMRYNWSFKNTAISKKEKKRLTREAKRQRIKNNKHTKQNSYTGYKKTKVQLEWKRLNTDHMVIYQHPVHKYLVYDPSTPLLPVFKTVYVSDTENANINNVLYTKCKVFQEEKKSMFN